MTPLDSNVLQATPNGVLRNDVGVTCVVTSTTTPIGRRLRLRLRVKTSDGMNEPTTTPNKQQSAPSRPHPRRWLMWLLMFVMLFSGMVIGAGGAAIVIRSQVISHLHEPERMPERATKMLARRLDLSDEQTAEVKQILVYRQQELLAIRRETLPRVNEQLDQVEQEIAAVLINEQRTKFAADFQRLRETWVPQVK